MGTPPWVGGHAVAVDSSRQPWRATSQASVLSETEVSLKCENVTGGL